MLFPTEIACVYLLISPLLWMLISSFTEPGSTVTIRNQLLTPPFTLDGYKVLRHDGTGDVMEMDVYKCSVFLLLLLY